MITFMGIGGGEDNLSKVEVFRFERASTRRGGLEEGLGEESCESGGGRTGWLKGI